MTDTQLSASRLDLKLVVIPLDKAVNDHPVNITVLDGTVPVLLYGRNWYCSDTVFPVHGIGKVPNSTVLHIVPIPSSTVYRYRVPDDRYKHGTGLYCIGACFWLARARPAIPLGLWSITPSLRGNLYVPCLHKFIKWFADNDVTHPN